jgi:Ran GTPase-activating protein (RanGAP) involved in mRNA processing and transport
MTSGLKHIDLNGNCLMSKGVSELFSAPSTTQIRHKTLGYLSIQKLDLSGNSIDEQGIRALCNFITKSVLQELSLANNFLYVEGTKALIEALIENKSLRKLNLASNFMKDEGCQMLCFYLGL